MTGEQTRFGRRRAPAILATALLCGLVLAECAAQFRRLPPLQPQTEPPQPKLTVPSEYIYTPLSSLSRNLKHALERGDVTQTMAIVQAILSSDEDSFADISFTEDSEIVPSLKKLVRAYVEELPPAEFEKYRDRWEIDAEVLLESARKTGNLQDYLQLAEQYYYTRSGFAAVDFLATRALDLGRFLVAARLWNDLIDSRWHRNDVGVSLLFKAALANRLAGNGERASELFARVQKSPRGAELADKLQQALDRTSPPNAVATETQLPPLPSHWQFPLLDPLSHEQKTILDQWRREQWSDSLQPLSMPRMGVAAGRFAAVAEFNRLVLLDLESGRLCAEYPLARSLSQISDSLLEIPLQRNSMSRFARQYDLYEQMVWNTLEGRATTDGRSLFLIESDDRWVEESPLRPGERIGARIDDRRGMDRNDPIPVNRIVALPIPDGVPAADSEPLQLQPRWTAGERQSVANGFEGGFFLAPPVSLDGFLYTLMEQKDVLKLVCLDPVSGKLLWSQGLTHPGLLLFEDASRRIRSCELQSVGGLLVATTQVGVVVALDPVRKNLEWIYYVGEPETNRAFSSGIRMSQIAFGYLGFPDRIVADGNRICMLPRQSAFLHCLDATTGLALWKVPRHRTYSSDSPADGDDYLGGVHDNTLIVVGEYATRGLSLADGSEEWKVSHPRIAGMGLQRGATYLLPLESGDLMHIDIDRGEGAILSTGTVADSSQPPQHGLEQAVPLDSLTPALPRFGHLFAVGDRCVSVGLDAVRSFPLPQRELEHLDRQAELSPEQQLRRVLLAEDFLRQPDLNLLRQLSRLPGTSSVRDRARRELLQQFFARLESQRDIDPALLGEAQTLADTDDDRARILVLRLAQQLDEGDAAGILQSLRDLRRLDSETLYPVPGDAGLFLSLGGWSRAAWDWSQRESASGVRQQFRDLLQGEIGEALAVGDANELDRLLRQFPGLVELNPVRLALAKLKQNARDWHSAEMLLLAVLQRPESEPRERTAARNNLAYLWSEVGLTLQAARLLAETDIDGGDAAATVADIQTRLSRSTAAARLAEDWAKQQTYAGNLQRVFIESLAPSDLQRRLDDSFDDGLRFFPTEPENPFELIMKRTENFDDFRLSVISRATGYEIQDHSIPDRVNVSSRTRDMLVGHLLPVGCKWQIRGYSLLPSPDDGPAWTRSFPEPRLGKDPLSVGPLHPEFCGFRSDETAVLLDSRDGRVIWRRDGLGALNRRSRSETSMFGDLQVVTCGESDSQTYRHFETFTGREFRTQESLPWTGVLGTTGRNLVALDSTQDQLRDRTIQRIVVIDPMTGDRVVNEEYFNRNYVALHNGRLMWVTPDVRLKMIDPQTLESLVDIPLSRAEIDDIINLQAFEDRTTWYVNLRRKVDHRFAIEPQFSPRQANFASSTVSPFVDVQGILIAVDKATGQRRWTRTLQPASVMQLPNVRLPFLLTFSWMTERRGVQRKRLRLEVISTETGDLLGESEDFVPLDGRTQIIQAEYDARRREVLVNGLTYRARISFGSKLNELETDVPFY